MKVIGYHITDGYIANSLGKVCSEPPWTDFLFQQYTRDQCIKIFYDLDYSVACLLKMIHLPKECLETLAETTDLRVNYDEIGGFKILDESDRGDNEYIFQYIPRIWFSIKHKPTRSWVGFSNMKQYIDAPLEPTEDDIGDGIDFANTAQLTGQKIYKILTNLGLTPKTLTSPISCFNKEKLPEIPLSTIDDIPDEAARYSYECCKAGWIEAFKIGHFENTIDLDINSAYGYELGQLMNLQLGKWHHVTRLNSSSIYGLSIYGFYKGVVSISKPFSPIIFKNQTSSFTPIGEWETYLTTDEILFINKFELGSFEIEDGWCWELLEHPVTPSLSTIMPLNETIAELYARKKKAEDELEDDIIKRIIAGIYGKMLEYNEKGFGELFNPVWAAEVETNTRLKVAEFVLENNFQDNLLSITVDGILLSKDNNQLSNNLLSQLTEVLRRASVSTQNRVLGNWKVSAQCPAFVVSSGTQTIRDKNHANALSLNYNWLQKQIEWQPKANQYTLCRSNPITLAKAITQDKIEKLGNLEPLQRIIEVDCEMKRCYRKLPKNGKELLENQYSSTPWDISLLSNEEALNESTDKES